MRLAKEVKNKKTRGRVKSTLKLWREEMKNKNRFIALLSLTLLVVALASTAVSAKEANTIDELVAMYDDSKCAKCHEDIYKQWQESWHSKAIISSLGGMRNFIAIGLAKEWDKPLTKAQVLKCLDCHAPSVNFASEKLAVKIGNLIVTAKDKAGKKAGDKAKAELARLSVGCLSCHNIKATTIARGLRGDPVKGTIYGPHGNDSDGHRTVFISGFGKTKSLKKFGYKFVLF